MTNDFENEKNDDFVESEDGTPEEYGQRPGGGGLANAWRTNPLVKFGVLVVGVFAVGAGAMNFFGAGETDSATARLNRPPSLKEAPGGVVSPYMRQQTELANTERVKQAIETGGSALPTPIGQASDASVSDPLLGKREDPLKALRAETEQLKRQIQRQQSVSAQQAMLQQRPPERFDDTLAQAMQKQMQDLSRSWAPAGLTRVTVSEGTTTRFLDGDGKDGGKAAISKKPIISAGTVSYAQLLTEANSDVPGPILAQIVSGPLAGARAVGSFQVALGYEKYLVMKFTLADKKGKEYAINAIALDPDTTLGGMATEVDERYFARVILPAAASFLEGLGSSLGDTESSISTTDSATIVTQAEKGFQEGLYTGIGQGAETIGQFFQQQANVTKPLVRVAAGTPFGLLFVTAVKEAGAPREDSSPLLGSVPLGVRASAAEAAASVPYPNYATPSARRGSSLIQRGDEE